MCMILQDDIRWMQVALRMAERAQGRTAENPAVGCVIIRDDQLVGTGWTQSGGRPHAETQALTSAAVQARGATAYVTLEPCAHHGQTPPCSQALLDAGIARAVVACLDDDARVSGQGVAQLKAAGCDVMVGVCESQARRINAGFFSRLSGGLPDISIKIATSSDEKITTGNSDSLWITNDHSRAYGHYLRAEHQAIVTGIGTVLADNPSLTCRLSGLTNASPIRVVLDHHLQVPLDAALVKSANDVPVWVITNQSMQGTPQAQALVQANVVCLFLPDNYSFSTAMQCLARQHINRALIEGGQGITSAALTSGCATKLYWFQAAHAIGDKGLNALYKGTLHECADNHENQTIMLGSDMLTTIRLRN